jgi:DNA-binding NarL/FixJ family response regulator
LAQAFKDSGGFALAEILPAELLGTENIMPTVLVVSGDTAFRKQLRALFNHDNGFEAFVEAGNAVEAMAKAKRRPPNLAVLDFPSPDVGGLQLAQKLKASKPELPIFLLTTDYSVYTEKKALSCGITAVFCKLDDLETLLANARAVCGIE